MTDQSFTLTSSLLQLISTNFQSISLTKVYRYFALLFLQSMQYACSQISMVRSGWQPIVRGFSAFDVLIMNSYLSFLTSQVHPDPKLPTAFVMSSFARLSTLFHLASIFFKSYPVGYDLKGLMQYQQKEWFQCCAALLKIFLSVHLRINDRILHDDFLQWLFLPWSIDDRIVEIVNVGLVMLAVVVVKCFSGDLMWKGSFFIRKRRKLKHMIRFQTINIRNVDIYTQGQIAIFIRITAKTKTSYAAYVTRMHVDQQS